MREMRAVTTATLMLALAAGCGGPDPAANPAATRAAHEQMVASLSGEYIWDCTLTSETGFAPWHFVLQREGAGAARDVVVREAGNPLARTVTVRKDAAARIYLMQDRSRILIASDGEVQLGGESIARAKDYSAGSCRKGGQPA